MTLIYNITGSESTRDLLELRRADKRNRRQQRAEQLFGDVVSLQPESENTDSASSHAPLFPLIA